MDTYAELELSLSRRGGQSYALELRFNQPNSDADIRLLRDGPALVQIDLAALRASELDADEYGKLLGGYLLAEPAARGDFDQVRASAQSLDTPLRMRLCIGPDATELHNLHWEALRDPRDGALLCTGEQVLFSRYLSSVDWRPVQLRAKGDLRALVVIANPAELERYNLAPIDVEGEQARATASLGTIPATTLLSSGSTTLEALIAHLRDGYDILYLVAHGSLVQDESWLWLEDSQGSIARVSGSELVARIRELQQRPRLVVLAACQSAGTGQEPRSADAAGALAALGPRLAEAGIPAVLAMQGNITMATIARFMPVFFQELQRDGQIDRAVAVARGAVRDRDDFWMPALFMRLRSGRVWYTPTFATGGRGRADEQWEPLIASIRDEECTPIIGPDLTEALIGARSLVARRMAEAFQFPFAPYDRENLPRVAQYLAVYKTTGFMPRTLAQYLCQELRARHGEELPAELRAAALETASRKELLRLLETLLDYAWQRRQSADPDEPHRVLASLPLPIYITADSSNLLPMALRAAGKQPQVVMCPWNDYTRQAPSIYLAEPDYEPEPARPLVYQLFGRLDEPDSIVLAEDDFFDHLIGITRNKDLIPAAVRHALADTALLFLGFRMDDWTFRVFFRSLLSQQGSGRRSHYPQIAVQVAPDDDRIVDPVRAQRYLEEYVNRGAAIDVYWGSSQDFVGDLARRWGKR
jgi:hypothetical protein